MLHNLVNRHDAGRAYRKIAAGDLGAVAAKLRGSSRDRVVRQWNDTAPEPTQWWSIPAVRRRWNQLMTGDERIDFPAHVAANFLSGSGLRALSLGCGLGGRELRWAELGVFEKIDAFDIAPATGAAAAARAHDAGYADVVDFEVRDVTTLDDERRYDVVLAEHSLHHLAPMPDVVSKIAGMLEPGGLFVVDEFVGPQRFQWTRRQIAEAQMVLDAFPDSYKVISPGVSKRRIVRPSKLWMLLTDPSEAIDSARIRPVLHEQLEVVEERPYGGAVLHLALADIAQNFLDDSPETNHVLGAAFEAEDRLMASGAVGSDFTAFVCRTRAGAVR
jgi:2-polyprenyl-3-methyl-5-hydroxy-6-metoxy-1,4-benzoquinol methylase